MPLSKLKQTLIKNKEDFFGPIFGRCRSDAFENNFTNTMLLYGFELLKFFIIKLLSKLNIAILNLLLFSITLVSIPWLIYIFIMIIGINSLDNKCINRLEKLILVLSYIIMGLLSFKKYGHLLSVIT